MRAKRADFAYFDAAARRIAKPQLARISHQGNGIGLPGVP
jgi:hypothetical protein